MTQQELLRYPLELETATDLFEQDFADINRIIIALTQHQHEIPEPARRRFKRLLRTIRKRLRATQRTINRAYPCL